MQRTAALLLISGSIVFIAAIMSPPMFNVFSVEDPAQAAAAFQENMVSWRLANGFAAIGALIAAAGIVLLARYITALDNNPQMRVSAYLGATLVFIGALLWLVIQFDRMTVSPERFVSGEALGGPWLFPLYVIVTLLGLIVIGYGLLKAGYPRWLGWFVIGVHSLLLVAGLATQDAVPLNWYLSMLVMGIALLFVRPAVTDQSRRDHLAVGRAPTGR